MTKTIFIIFISHFFLSVCFGYGTAETKQPITSPQELCKKKGLRSKGELVHLIDDVSHLNETKITCIIQPISVTETSEIVSFINQWNQNLDPDKRISISIAGTKHSQGGHIANKHGITLELSKLNQVDTPTQRGDYWEVKVQAGALWSQVHEVVKSHGGISLANKVQQSSTPFSVGGSLSVNAHGRNFHYGSMIHSVKAITLIVANGDIMYASREKNSELFRLAIGGYGLFGIIAEVHLELLPNHQLTLDYKRFANPKDYIDFFTKELNLVDRGEITRNTEGHITSERYSPTAYLFATMELDKDNFLNGMKSYIYQHKDLTDNTGEVNTDLPPNIYNLRPWITQIGFSLKKRGYWIKTAQKLQHNFLTTQDTRLKILTPPIKSVLATSSKKSPDLLQEYFIPTERVPEFLVTVKEVFQNNDIILSNVSLRFIPRSTDRSFLTYTLEDKDQFAIVLYFSMDRDKINSAENWTKKLVKNAISLGGRHYLPYQLWPTRNQVKTAYPMFNQFIQKKKHYDPDELFSNKFYERYKSN